MRAVAVQGQQAEQAAAVDRHRALSLDDSAAIPAPPLDADTAVEVREGSLSADGTPPAGSAAAVSTTVRASEADGVVVVVAETDGRDVVREASQTAGLSASQPSLEERTASPAAIDHDSHAAVAEQPSASEDRQLAAADADDAPAADADNARPVAELETQWRRPDAEAASEASPRTELERQAGEAGASARLADRLEEDSLQRAAAVSEPVSGVASPSEQPIGHEVSSPADATEPVAAAHRRADEGDDDALAAIDSEAVSSLLLPALDEEFPPSEPAAEGGTAAPLHVEPFDGDTELPAAPVEPAATVDQSAALTEPAELAPAGEPLDDANDIPAMVAEQRQPSAPEAASQDGAVESLRETATLPSPAGVKTLASEAADVVMLRQQDVSRLVGTAAAALDSSSALSAEQTTEQAAVRQHVQVPDFAKHHV